MRYEDSANEPPTAFDVFITKVVGEFHERVVAAITTQFGVYAGNTGSILSPGGGNMNVQIPRTRQHVIREPYQALRPKYSSAGDNPVRPRLIVEVEVKIRTVRGAHNLARIVMFFGRQVDGTCACLAILYRRIKWHRFGRGEFRQRAVVYPSDTGASALQFASELSGFATCSIACAEPSPYLSLERS